MMLASLLTIGLIVGPVLAQSPVHLKVDTKDLGARNKTAPNLYGLFFEDINVSYAMIRLISQKKSFSFFCFYQFHYGAMLIAGLVYSIRAMADYMRN